MATPSSEIAATESLLAFWRDAGVDACFEDAPVDRTFVSAPPEQKATLKAVASVTAAPDLGDAVSEARRLAAGAGDLDALKDAIAAFTGCPLRDMGAKQAVFSRGDPE